MSEGAIPAATPAVPVAPGLRAALADLATALPTDLRTVEDVLAYRAAGAARATTAAEIAARLNLSFDDVVVAGSEVTVFRAVRNPAARVVFLHGGGLVAGCRFDGADVLARHARELSLEVWTAEYPLAPEHRFDEMVAAAVEVVAAAVAEGLPVILAGQSAGGGVAAATALECRERGIPLLGQLLICPMLSRVDTPSIRQYPRDVSWSPVSSATAWRMALDGSDALPPGERTDLTGLAPTFLDSGSAEIFRDAIVRFASDLWARGGRAELHVWSGGFHASDGVDETPVASAEAHRARREWLRRLLADEL